MYLNQIYLGERALRGGGGGAGLLRQAGRASWTRQRPRCSRRCPRRPSTYDPRRNPVAAVQRRNLVLGMMAGGGADLPADAGAAGETEPLGLVPPLEAKGEAPYFVAAVRQELRERFGPDAETAGLPRLHLASTGTCRRRRRRRCGSSSRRSRRGSWGASAGPTAPGPGEGRPADCLQGLFVAIDGPDGRRPRAGGRARLRPQPVRPGDAGAAAGGLGVQAASSTPPRWRRGSRSPPRCWAPARPTSRAATAPRTTSPTPSRLDLRDGLRLSSNRAAVALGERVGVANVVQTAHNLGITTPIQPYPSTFLGAADVIPIELVARVHGVRQQRLRGGAAPHPQGGGRAGAAALGGSRCSGSRCSPPRWRSSPPASCRRW